MSDNFEMGVFWELYLDLERNFQNFLEYVPYLKGNAEVYSFKLLNLILSIGGHVDSAFKEMAYYPSFSMNRGCQEILRILKESDRNIRQGKAPRTVPISLPLKVFGEEYRISKKKIIFKRLPERELITPFHPYNPRTKAPEWWEIYNGLKHNVSLNLKKANMQNTLHALAGAFLLNVRHLPAALRLYDFDLVKFSHGVLPRTLFKELLEDEKRFHTPCFIETRLFRYDYVK